MLLHTEEDITKLVSDDKWMMEVLRLVETLQLKDWWVCAGFVRSKIWDALQPLVPWSVKNQARMHLANQTEPYLSSIDAMSKFPETVTALGLTLDHNSNVRLAAPCGITDVIQMQVKPTPLFAMSAEKLSYYKTRVARKNWQVRWPLVQIYEG